MISISGNFNPTFGNSMNKIITIVAVLLISSYGIAQPSLINGKLIQFGSKSPLPMCRVIINNSIEHFSDTSGYFRMNTKGIEIKKIEFTYLGYYPLTLKNLPKADSLKIEVALVAIDVADDYFLTIKENGKRNKKIDKERARENEKEMIRQASRAYVIYNGNQINAQNGLVNFKNCR
jgi:hypothetical protein